MSLLVVIVRSWNQRNIDENWNSYFSLAYTSREPRLKNLYDAEEAYDGYAPQFQQSNGTYDYSNPLVKPEHLFDVELGTGYQDKDTRFTANVYWMEFTDELVENGQIDIFGEPITGNANRTRHIGLELDGATKVNPEFTLSGNMTFSHNRLIDHTEYVSQTDTSGNTTEVPQSLNGNPIAGFPDFLANIRITYHYSSITSSLVYKYVGPFYTDNFKNEANKNDEYSIINFEFLYKLPRMFGSDISVHAEVRNLLNTFYTMNGEGDQFFPAAERNYLMGLTLNL